MHSYSVLAFEERFDVLITTRRRYYDPSSIALQPPNKMTGLVVPEAGEELERPRGPVHRQHRGHDRAAVHFAVISQPGVTAARVKF